MKRISVLGITFICALVVLMGCTKPPVPQVSESIDEETIQTRQLLSNESTTGYYRTMLPYVSSPTRGLVYSYLSNRYDIDEYELALMRESQQYYNPDDVYFQDGQLLTKGTVRRLLAKKKTEAELNEELAVDEDYVDIGLNPSKDEIVDINGVSVNPVYLAYLLEQDYLTVNGDETKLDGVSIGLALNPYQTWENELGYTQTVKLDEDQLIQKGQEIAQQLVDILRTQPGLEEVQIMLGLYVLEADNAVIPGHMVAKTLVSSQSSKIKNWETVNEQYFSLPDQNTLSIDTELSNQFTVFKDKIKEYYPHYYGVIGVAHFVNDQLSNLEITLNIDFYGLAEKLSFHQLVSQLITETFSPQYDINVIIRSSDEVYGVLQRPANASDVTLKLISWE